MQRKIERCGLLGRKQITERMKLSRIHIFIFILLLAACSKDDDDSTDVCDIVVCYNGGYCEDGSCKCPEGYEGLNCLDVISPRSIVITSIEFSRFPRLKGNLTWDFDTNQNAEPFIRISQDGVFKWNSDFNAFPDAEPDELYTITPNTLLEFFDFTDITFSLLDWDEIGGDDLIDTYSVTMFNAENGLPRKLEYQMNNGTKLSLWVIYKF